MTEVGHKDFRAGQLDSSRSSLWSPPPPHFPVGIFPSGSLRTTGLVIILLQLTPSVFVMNPLYVVTV